MTGPKNERAGDDSANFVLTGELFASDLAPPIELFQGNDLLVRCYLEDAVSRSVNDWTAGLNVQLPKLFDDLGPRSRLVTENLSSDRSFERLDHPRRKTFGIGWKGLIGDNASHFPVPGGCIFSA